MKIVVTENEKQVFSAGANINKVEKMLFAADEKQLITVRRINGNIIISITDFTKLADE